MKKQAEKKKNPALYILGTVALAAGAMIVAPKVIDFLARQFERPAEPRDVGEDDWGPEIVRREKAAKENEDGEL